MTRRHIVVLLIALLIVLLISVLPSRATRDAAGTPKNFFEFQSIESTMERCIGDELSAASPLEPDRIPQ